MAYLTLREGEARRLYQLGPSVSLGRETDCEVIITDPQASRRHAEIREAEGRYFLRDLKTTNGTWVWGQRIKTETPLEDGDEITVGATTLVFTRHLPPGAENLVERAGGEAGPPAEPPPTQPSLATTKRSPDRVPRGTMVVPIERFGLRPTPSGAPGPSVAGPSTAAVPSHWLRGLYQVLREAAQCEDEDELFSAATRILAETLGEAKLTVAFEAEAGSGEGGHGLQVSVWAAPGGKASGGAEALAGARAALLRHARARGVAVLSQDVELDARAAEAAARQHGVSKVLIRKQLEAEGRRERIALMIAPLLAGRSALGYLIAERTWRGSEAGGAPFQPEHLEFLAAAAYPLAATLVNLRRRQRVFDENTRLRRTLEGKHQIVGDSKAMQAVVALAQRAATADSPLLLLGESGTGKELVARALHAWSRRARGPFEAINCAALPENLVESELFGHAKGAFTGATQDRPGIFETASGGTLFLDEIGELPALMQSKFLRVLEEGKLARVGETRLRDTDCRILCATNRDLAAEAAAGRFRQDLYYRLRVLEITLPPLRERLDDLPALCRHLLEPFGPFEVHPDVLAIFQRYRWPGNIRELRNTLERMAVLSRPTGTILARGGRIQLRPQDVPLDIRRAIGGLPAPTEAVPAATLAGAQSAPAPDEAESFRVAPSNMPPLEQLQVAYVRWVLEQVKGNKAQAARVLGIQRSTIYSWTEWGDRDAPRKGGK